MLPASGRRLVRFGCGLLPRRIRTTSGGLLAVVALRLPADLAVLVRCRRFLLRLAGGGQPIGQVLSPVRLFGLIAGPTRALAADVALRGILARPESFPLLIRDRLGLGRPQRL